MVKAVPLKLLNILTKIQNSVKYTLKMGKTASVSETEKMYDSIYFFGVLVGKTDFNIQKSVSEKNTVKTPKNSKLP